MRTVSPIVASRRRCIGSIPYKSSSTNFSLEPPVRDSLRSFRDKLAHPPFLVALPGNIISALSLVRLASHWMFALFLTGACTCFVSIFLTPLSIFTRWATFPIAIFAFLSALATTVATVVATIMFIIFRNVVHSAEDTVNIVPEIGIKMFACMWIASACSIIGWMVQMGMCCCCVCISFIAKEYIRALLTSIQASRRDVKLGKKTGRIKAWPNGEVPRGELPPHELRQHETRGKRSMFGRKRE